jgi:hypothetical protein
MSSARRGIDVALAAAREDVELGGRRSAGVDLVDELGDCGRGRAPMSSPRRQRGGE